MAQPHHQLPPLPLLRSILRVHRKLPPALRFMGDRYVLDEFKRHAKADPQFVSTFLRQWNSYLETVKGQVAREEARGRMVGITGEVGEEQLGRKLSREEMDKLTDAQVGQLWALKWVGESESRATGER